MPAVLQYIISLRKQGTSYGTAAGPSRWAVLCPSRTGDAAAGAGVTARRVESCSETLPDQGLKLELGERLWGWFSMKKILRRGGIFGFGCFSF